MAAVYLEIGTKRVFACAVDWPGWCRSGPDSASALAALNDYIERYEMITARAHLAFDPGDLRVVERVPGNTTTDVGAPDRPAAADARPVDEATAHRQAAVLRSAWDMFAEVAAATPAELRKGPRGGGRDRDRLIQHVISAEASYGRRIGVRHRAPALGDIAAIEALRTDILTVLGTPSAGTPAMKGGWPLRYAARRITWHVLDHLWEMQDRTKP